MKIAFVVSSFPIMSEKFILSQITGLIDRGHEVAIFPEKIASQEKMHLEIEEYGVSKRVYTQTAHPKTRVARILKSLFFLAFRFPLHPILMFKLLKLFITKYSKKSLLTFLNWTYPFIKEDFDVIHCHFGPNGNRCINLKELGLRSKLITTFHGYDVTVYTREYGHDVYNELFRYCDIFTYNSESTRQKVLALGCPAEKMVKLPMGVHLDKIPFKERTVSSDGFINILSVGRLVEMKGREYAIQAMAKLIHKYPNVRYTIVGDGPLREKLKAMVDEEGLSENIEFESWVSTERLDQLYNEAHIYLHPSVVASNGNTEGQGVVLAEAQAYGIPVLATRHGAFPDSILEGESGFLVPERDVDSLYEKLEYLILNPEKWGEVGKKGREFVEQRFDNNLLTEKLVNIYTGDFL